MIIVCMYKGAFRPVGKATMLPKCRGTRSALAQVAATEQRAGPQRRKPIPVSRGGLLLSKGFLTYCRNNRSSGARASNDQLSPWPFARCFFVAAPVAGAIRAKPEQLSLPAGPTIEGQTAVWPVQPHQIRYLVLCLPHSSSPCLYWMPGTSKISMNCNMT